jgi:hypothetical protein
MRNALLLAAGIVVALISYAPTRDAILRGVSSSPAPQPPQSSAEHLDHEPKHGGTFFMAMNNHHHLEGVLEPSGIFRVYLYDSFTQPLTPDKMEQASGKVLVGDDENAPEIPLTLSRDGKTLEASLGGNLKLPMTLTLLMHFPGMSREARPELFTFPFREYSKSVLPR